MKKQKINLISTVLFLCVVFSIIIISLNTNIKKETKIIKQMNESTQISDLQTQINQLNVSQTEYANSIQTAKRTLASAIANQGINTSENDSFDTMAANIAGILQARTSNATAKAEDITEAEKTAYVNGNKIVGTAVSKEEAEIKSVTLTGRMSGSAAYYLFSTPVNAEQVSWWTCSLKTYCPNVAQNVTINYNYSGNEISSSGAGFNAGYPVVIIFYYILK